MSEKDKLFKTLRYLIYFGVGFFVFMIVIYVISIIVVGNNIDLLT